MHAYIPWNTLPPSLLQQMCITVIKQTCKNLAHAPDLGVVFEEMTFQTIDIQTQ